MKFQRVTEPSGPRTCLSNGARPATPTARRLRVKLEVLAERGVDGEQTLAKAKLARLLKQYDFNAPVQEDVRNLFKGVFIKSYGFTEPIARLDPWALDVAGFVKWAIENRCDIPCLFKNGELHAQATPPAARQLTVIAKAITDAFTILWDQFRAAPGVNLADRGNFLLGLYEGMMGDERSGEALPKRAEPWKPAKAKKKAVAHVAGVTLHPYSVAVALGRQITFCVPLDSISQQLTDTIRGAIPENTKTP